MNRIKDSYRRSGEYLLQLPMLTWVLLGFFITFVFFFIGPIFLDPSHVMQFKPYVFILQPIGNDFHVAVASSSAWIHTGAFVATEWPPLTTVFLAPFTLVGPQTGYGILLFLIVGAYTFATLTIPRWINKSSDISAFAMLIFLGGIVSYGFQFELERGQFNVIAFAFCLAAIYLFHSHPRFRWLAYVLFSIAVQWKLYPAIFIFALIDDWADWKNNLKRVFGLAMVNILALFAFGVNALRDTLGMFAQEKDLHLARYYNLSITSFSYYALRSALLPGRRTLVWIEANAWILEVSLLVLFLLGFLLIIRHACKNKIRGFNPYVLMACTIGACVIPSLSYDYKLSLLPPAIALAIPGIVSLKENANRLREIVLAFLFSLAFSSTLYSFTNKPSLLQYNLPALFLMMLCTVYACLTSDNIRAVPARAEDVASHADDPRGDHDSPSASA